MEKLNSKLCSVSIVLLMLVRFCSAHECTINPDEIRNVRLEAVKWEILLKLRFVQPPKNPDPNVPLIINQSLLAEYRAVVELLDQINGNRDPCVTAGTSSQQLLIFLLTSVETFSGQAGNVFDSDEGILVVPLPDLDDEGVADRYRLKFFINVSNSDVISHAELRLLKKPRSSNSQPSVGIGEERVELYLISRPRNFFGEFPEFITAQRVSSDTEGFVLFDILNVIEKWVEFNNTYFARELELEIVIRCPELIETGVHYQPGFEFVFDSNQTTQVVITTYKDLRRRKRANDAAFCMSKLHDGHTCCVRPLEINFREDFGWFWVIYPRSIEISYCEGFCPYSQQNYNSLLLSLNPTSSPEPCCVPVRFQSIALLMFVNGTAVNEILEDVKVHSCSCR